MSHSWPWGNQIAIKKSNATNCFTHFEFWNLVIHVCFICFNSNLYACMYLANFLNYQLQIFFKPSFFFPFSSLLKIFMNYKKMPQSFFCRSMLVSTTNFEAFIHREFSKRLSKLFKNFPKANKAHDHNKISIRIFIYFLYLQGSKYPSVIRNPWLQTSL